MKKLAVLCTSRNRLKNATRCYEYFLKNSSDQSDFYLIIRQDEQELYRPLDCKKIVVSDSPRYGMSDPLNEGVRQLLDKHWYDYVYFLGDDHVIQTKNWDEIFINYLSTVKNNIGIVYGNDLLRKEQLPTACLVSSKIIKELGHMCYPKLCHLYIDNYWKDLGLGCGILKYFDDVVIEHFHFANKKSEMDENYQKVNARSLYASDGRIYKEWYASDRLKEINKIRGLL